jgi:hypothetical protein
MREIEQFILSARSLLCLCWLLSATGCGRSGNLVDRIRSGDSVKQVTFGVHSNQVWVQRGRTLTNPASVDCLSRQIATSKEEALMESYNEARFVLKSGYSEEVILMVIPEPKPLKVCLGVNFGLFKDPDWFLVDIPADAPGDLRGELLLLANPTAKPPAGQRRNE